MNLKPLAVIAVTVSLAGCASTSTVASPPAAQAGSPSAPSAPAPAPSVISASQQVCLTKACIIHDLDQSLVGLVANDEAVSVKASCRKSTVRSYPDQVYSASCTVTYSDGSTAEGTGNLLMSQNKVTFTPAGA